MTGNWMGVKAVKGPFIIADLDGKWEMNTWKSDESLMES